MSSRAFVVVLVLGLGVAPAALHALGNAEISYWVNGKAYTAYDGTLVEESTGKPLPASTQGKRQRWYQGGTSVGRPLLHLAALQEQRETGVKEDYLFEPMGGSQTSRAVLSGQLDWGVIGRDLFVWEKDSGLKVQTVAWDALFVVVPADLPVDNIPLRKLAAIYVGQVTNWSELGGPDLPIAPFAYSEFSGSAGAFRDLVLERFYGDDGRLTKRATLLDFDAEVYDRVGAQPGAIGFGPRSLDSVEATEAVKFLKVDTIAPDPEEISVGRYPLTRPINFLTLGDPSPRAQALLDWIMGERIQGALDGLRLSAAN